MSAPRGREKGSVLGFSRDKELNIYTYDMIKNCFTFCKGWEVTVSAIWKLETQKSQQCNSVQVQRPENQGTQRYKSQHRGRRGWDEMSQLKQCSRNKGRFLFPLPFCFNQTFSGWDEAHSHCGGWSALQSPLLHMLVSSRNTQTYPEIRYNLGPPWPVEVTHTINHHKWQHGILSNSSACFN